MTTAPTRPAVQTSTRPATAGPIPRQRPAWQDLFREAVYADGPYDRSDEDDPEDDS